MTVRPWFSIVDSYDPATRARRDYPRQSGLGTVGVAVGAVGLATLSAVLLIPFVASLASAAAAPAPGSDPTPDRGDKVVLTNGTVLEGTLLDRHGGNVVILTEAGKQVVPEAEVEEVDRVPVESREAELVAAVRGKSTLERHWRKLAEFCRERALWPEERDALREVLAFAPNDDEVHKRLGQARLDGSWIPEEEVAKRLAGGWTIAIEGPCACPVLHKEGRTTVETRETPSSLHFLPRSELTDAERKRMLDERARREDIAKKFREKLAREYEGVPWSDRYKVRSKYGNFEVHCNATLELAERYAMIMEIIRAKLHSMFRSQILKRTMSPVFIYCNQEEFMNNDDFAQFAGRGLGGYYMPLNSSITTYHGTFGFTGTTFSVLAHEGTHYYQGLVLKGGFDNLPIWLIEGLAVYFGDGGKFDAKSAKFTVGHIPRDRLAHIQEKMEIERHVPVKDLVKMNRLRFGGSQYADAWALIYFLVRSSKEGERLMQEYWARGVEQKLEFRDFEELAEKYFGSIDELEEKYVAYIKAVKPPPAGEIRGDWFTSEEFQFEFQAPSSDWQFFEDSDDKNLLIGLALPSTSAQIRLYYRNNIENKQPKDWFKDWLKYAERSFEDLQHEEVKIAGLDGFKATYLDKNSSDIEIDLSDIGEIDPESLERIRKRLAGDDEEAKPRRVTSFILAQVDGVATIECSAEDKDVGQFRDLFDKMNQNFSLLLIRRW